MREFLPMLRQHFLTIMGIAIPKDMTGKVLV